MLQASFSEFMEEMMALTKEEKELKEYLKKVSGTIWDLAEDLESGVDDETDPNVRKALKQKISDAKNLSDSLDDKIHELAMKNLQR